MVGKLEQLNELATIQAKDIDTSDAPELKDKAWSTAERGRFYRPKKVQKRCVSTQMFFTGLRAKGRAIRRVSITFCVKPWAMKENSDAG